MTRNAFAYARNTALLALCLAAGCFNGDKGSGQSSSGSHWLACSDDRDCAAQGKGATCGEKGLCVDAAGEPISVSAGAGGTGGEAGTTPTAGTTSVGTGGTGALPCTDCCAGVPGACDEVNCDCSPTGGTGASGTGATGGMGGTGSVCDDCCAGIPNPGCAVADCACPNAGSGGTGAGTGGGAGGSNAEPTPCTVGADCIDGEVCVNDGAWMPVRTCQPDPCAGQALSCTCAEPVCTIGTCSQAKDRSVDCVCLAC